MLKPSLHKLIHFSTILVSTKHLDLSSSDWLQNDHG